MEKRPFGTVVSDIDKTLSDPKGRIYGGIPEVIKYILEMNPDTKFMLSTSGDIDSAQLCKDIISEELEKDNLKFNPSISAYSSSLIFDKDGNVRFNETMPKELVDQIKEAIKQTTATYTCNWTNDENKNIPALCEQSHRLRDVLRNPFLRLGKTLTYGRHNHPYRIPGDPYEEIQKGQIDKALVRNIEITDFNPINKSLKEKLLPALKEIVKQHNKKYDTSFAVTAGGMGLQVGFDKADVLYEIDEADLEGGDTLTIGDGFSDVSTMVKVVLHGGTAIAIGEKADEIINGEKGVYAQLAKLKERKVPMPETLSVYTANEPKDIIGVLKNVYEGTPYSPTKKETLGEKFDRWTTFG